jgi:hypothetical protein
MASQFEKIKFPNPNGLIKNAEGQSPVAVGYARMYKLYSDLSGAFGDNVVEAGVVKMINDWNPNSDLESSFKSMATGMSGAGASFAKVSSILKKVEDQFVSSVSQK